MIENYFKVILRNLFKHKLYSSITIVGLSIGMACFFLISCFLDFESSYDSFHKNKNYIYRVDKVVQAKDYTYQRAFTGGVLAPALLNNFPSIKNAVRFSNTFTSIISVSNKIFKEQRFLFADGNLLDVFSFVLLKGNPQTVLTEPFSVVITPSISKKYFGNDNPIGKTILYQNKYSFTVTGLIDEAPSNSSIKYDFIGSFSSLVAIMGKKAAEEDWDGRIWTFIQLNEKTERQDLENQFPKFVEENIIKGDMNPVGLKLIPMKDLYYTKSDGAPLGDYGIKPITYILFFISVLILLVACVNFTNLLFARSTTRGKEIGIRKVQGASRSQLVIQFLGESFIISFISLFISIGLIEMLLPFFISIIQGSFPTFGFLADRKINFGILNFNFLGYMTAITTIVGLISGFYPAIYLSKLNPAIVIKGELKGGKSSAWIRKVLIIFQFSVAIIFINCTIVLLQQISFWKNKDLGFKQENIISIPIYSNSYNLKYDVVKNALMQNANIISVTRSQTLPGGVDCRKMKVRTGSNNETDVVIFNVDYSFIKTVRLKIISGRDFSEDFGDAAKSSIIMNESAMKKFGWSSANNQNVELYSEENSQIINMSYCNIVGVVNNFTYRQFANSNDPLILKIAPKNAEYMLIRINNNSQANAVEHIRKIFTSFNLQQNFEYSYLVDDIEKEYSIFDASTLLISISSLIEFLIASIGLLALSSFMIERRTKEIGIRKVFGAKTWEIIYELSKSFIILVIIAILISVPFSYWMSANAVQGIENHSEVNVLTFIITSFFVIFISILVVGSKSFMAARANPVETLRYE